jgi:hypothetical protein
VRVRQFFLHLFYPEFADKFKEVLFLAAVNYLRQFIPHEKCGLSIRGLRKMGYSEKSAFGR